jgi:hypothetical protein
MKKLVLVLLLVLSTAAAMVAQENTVEPRADSVARAKRSVEALREMMRDPYSFELKEVWLSGIVPWGSASPNLCFRYRGENAYGGHVVGAAYVALAPVDSHGKWIVGKQMMKLSRGTVSADHYEFKVSIIDPPPGISKEEEFAWVCGFDEPAKYARNSWGTIRYIGPPVEITTDVKAPSRQE